MQKTNTDGLLKMSELAAASGVSASTLKYYVKEGLVDIAYKTGPNMAYYHPSSVERVKLIKMLQAEKYYPLAVIKRLIQNGEMDMREIELMDVIHKTGKDSSTIQYTYQEALRQSGLTRAQAELLMAEGIITPVREGRKKLFRESDCRMMQLVKARMDAGIPFEQTLKAFKAYVNVLRAAAQADIQSLISDALMTSPLATRDIVRIIKTSDDTLNEFIMLKRYEYNSDLGSQSLETLGKFTAAFKSFTFRLRQILLSNGYNEQAAALESAAHGSGKSALLNACAQAIACEKSGLAMSLAACGKANGAVREGRLTPELKELEAALTLGWICLAPAEFNAGDAQEAKVLFAKQTGEAFFADVLAALEK